MGFRVTPPPPQSNFLPALVWPTGGVLPGCFLLPDLPCGKGVGLWLPSPFPPATAAMALACHGSGPFTPVSDPRSGARGCPWDVGLSGHGRVLVSESNSIAPPPPPAPPRWGVQTLVGWQAIGSAAERVMTGPRKPHNCRPFGGI